MGSKGIKGVSRSYCMYYIIHERFTLPFRKNSLYCIGFFCRNLQYVITLRRGSDAKKEFPVASFKGMKVNFRIF